MQGPAGGRIGKQQAQPSKRVPTTYISTDAATFRLTVQRVTSAKAKWQVGEDASIDFLLPTFDFEHLLPTTVRHSDPAAAVAQVAVYAFLHPLVEQSCFPTLLGSSNVIFDKN
ncbi:uncharacterized protein [Triticum aestivum]|uniref:uncharacterized protein n=1 Tax=Triticum aestivum TaxID=4565 RepID=UPI001D032E53|nr:uncharacterized protein LOC123170965 [Triticum aestivum]